MSEKNSKKAPPRPEIPDGFSGGKHFKDIFISRGFSIDDKYEIIWGRDRDKWPMDVRTHFNWMKEFRARNNSSIQRIRDQEALWLIPLHELEWEDPEMRRNVAGDQKGLKPRGSEWLRQAEIKRYLKAMDKMGKSIEPLIGPAYKDGKYYVTHFNGYTLSELGKLAKETEGMLHIWQEQQKAAKKKALETSPVEVINGKIIDPLKEEEKKMPVKEKRERGRPKKVQKEFSSARHVKNESLYDQFYDEDPEEFKRGIYKDAMIGLRKNVIGRDAASIKIALSEFKETPKSKTLIEHLKEKDADYVMRLMLRSDIFGKEAVFSTFVELFSSEWDINPRSMREERESDIGEAYMESSDTNTKEG